VQQFSPIQESIKFHIYNKIIMAGFRFRFIFSKEMETGAVQILIPG
jgi:hypothetical protein